jgi:hypothetical protein
MKYLPILLLFLSGLATGQETRHERIKALKTAFITEALSLSPEEAAQFWPVYNSYAEQMHELRKAERSEISERDDSNLTTLSDAEASRLVDRFLNYELREWELEKKLMADLKKIMTPQKIVMLKISEEKFKRRLLEGYKKGKE